MIIKVTGPIKKVVYNKAKVLAADIVIMLHPDLPIPSQAHS
jgi:hypothetical protein